MKKNYQLPIIQVRKLEYESMVADTGLSANFMSAPTVSEVKAAANNTRSYSVWDEDWSEE